MSPRDPFEAFRQSADQDRVFPFREEDWEDLEQRLETTLSTKSIVYPSPWWLLALMLPVLGLLFSLHQRGQEQYATNHRLLFEIELLRSDISAQKQAATIIKHDTIVLERVVYRNVPAKNREVILSNDFVLGSNAFPALYSLSSTLKELATSPLPIEKKARQLAVYPLLPQAIAQLSLKSNLRGRLPVVLPSLLPVRKLGLFKQPLIRSLDLTLVGGGSIAAKPPQANLLSVHLGARLNARFGHGWMLFTGLATRVSVYELDNPDSSLGIPVVDTPVEGYAFEDLQVKESANWWLLGAGWELPSRNRWRPFFEISYRKSFSHVSELSYAFQRLGSPEIVSEIDATLTPRPRDRITGGAGLWYVPKASNLQFGLGSTWSIPLGTDLLNQPRLGVNARLGISF